MIDHHVNVFVCLLMPLVDPQKPNSFFFAIYIRETIYIYIIIYTENASKNNGIKLKTF